MTDQGERPVRVQRRRTKGYKLPPNTKCVTRPGPWGNPFKVGTCTLDLPFLICKHWGSEIPGVLESNADAVHAFHIFTQRMHDGKRLAERARTELRGFNLACYCPLGSACHGDILLEIANS